MLRIVCVFICISVFVHNYTTLHVSVIMDYSMYALIIAHVFVYVFMLYMKVCYYAVCSLCVCMYF